MKIKNSLTWVNSNNRLVYIDSVLHLPLFPNDVNKTRLPYTVLCRVALKIEFFIHCDIIYQTRQTMISNLHATTEIIGVFAKFKYKFKKGNFYNKCECMYNIIN